MKNHSKLNKTIYALLILALICMTLVGCGGGDQSSSGNASQSGGGEKVIRVSVSGTPKIDPAVGNDECSAVALVNLYDSLVVPDYDGSIKPSVAKEWEVDEEGLNYTFYLNEGIKFHNGDELTAEDVAFSMERFMAVGEGFAYLFEGVIDSVSVVDDYTVKFTLTDSFGPFVNILPRLYILNKDQVVENIDESGAYGDMGDYGKDWLITNDAGSGPYVVKELQQQSHLYATKFDEYWQGWEEDAPEAIKIIDSTEAATIKAMMTNKELEITDAYQTEENLHAMEKIPGVSIAQFSDGSMGNLMLNNQKAPTDDVNFRKALAHLFDYSIIGEKIAIFNERATGPISKKTPGYNPDLYEYNLDIEKAKEYLSKSKYKDSLDQYPLKLVTSAGVPEAEKIALALQASAQQLGIKVEIAPTPWITITELVSTPESTPHICYIAVPINYNEAGAALESRYHSKSVGTWEQTEWLQNSEIDSMIEDALREIDEEKRFEKYKEIQQKLVEEICPSIWVEEENNTCAYQSDYVYWPAVEILKDKGEIVTMPMGYHFYFRDFKVTK